jgi:hypothetical protein
MYMPGLQALTEGTEGTMRARIAAWYTSSFTIGASLSFLLGRIGTLLGWRSALFLPASSVRSVWSLVYAPAPAVRNLEEPRPVLDIRPVLGNDALVLIFGYAAAIWGRSLRQWIVVFLAFCAWIRPVAAQA